MTNEEAIEILEEVKSIDDSMYQYNQSYMDALNMAIEALKNQPKQGHWVNSAGNDVCPVCGVEIVDLWMIPDADANYCPICGAIMRKENDLPIQKENN